MPKMVVRDANNPEEKPIKWFLKQGVDGVALRFEAADGSIWSALFIDNSGRTRLSPCIPVSAGLKVDSFGRMFIEK